MWQPVEGTSVRRLLLAACLGALTWSAAPALAGQVTIAAVAPGEANAWQGRIAAMLGRGDLASRQLREDTLLPGRQHERFRQLHRGVPVFGGELVLQTDAFGSAVSVFGDLYEGIEIGTTPALSSADVQRILETRGARPFGSQGEAVLVVLPLDAGGYALTYKARVVVENDIRLVFLDAHDGSPRLEFSDLQAQAVGQGTGVLGDRKKMSTQQVGSVYRADDLLRPPVIRTYDLRGDIWRLLNWLNGDIDLTPSDLASDSDNTWTDGANVDAHAYAGYVYDFLFKRFGRRGLDNANIPITSVTHPVRREDIRNSPNFELGTLLYCNAFYAGDGIMVYGEGLPPGWTCSGRTWNYAAGAIDIVAHELAHGVTDYSSQLIYRNESGALSESFSDVIGTAVEFYFQEAGSGPLRADYLAGEDIVSGGLRSLANPAAYGHPDHYANRYRGSGDNGGVHINSSISNHAFYLAIEGGTNRSSGLRVTGVGAGNREQIETVFYRGFAQMLPPNASFATARAATIQAARDLYGAGSAAERAIVEAWTAVGVN